MANRTGRVPMPEQDPRERATNFKEVPYGYTEEMARAEAARCLSCKKPLCQEGCPVGVKIRDFIALIKEGKYLDAARKVKETNSLPAVCGRVCPQEEQCEAKCILGVRGEPVAIGRLERFVADYEAEHSEPDEQAATAEGATAVRSNGRKVAVVGAGPAGLTCAGDLAKLGYRVTVFEALHAAGGVLIYGIPEFRLPKDIVRREVENLKRLGVDIQLNVIVGRTVTLEELKEMGYEAFFLGTGAGLPKFMGIPGENLNGVYSANEFLTRTNLLKAYDFPEYDTPIKVGKRVAVVGAGNVAMDAVRCALRLGAEEAYIIYRRSEAEMPVRKEELHHAKEEGVQFHLLTNPVRIIGDESGWVRQIECVRMELGEPDASGRRRPVEVPGSNFTIDVDVVVMALGTSPNPLIAMTTPGLATDKHGCLVVNEDTLATTREGVYAGGDAVTGAATVILAMGAGKRAAQSIHAYLSQR